MSEKGNTLKHHSKQRAGTVPPIFQYEVVLFKVLSMGHITDRGNGLGRKVRYSYIEIIRNT